MDRVGVEVMGEEREGGSGNPRLIENPDAVDSGLGLGSNKSLGRGLPSSLDSTTRPSFGR
jgi:hypothetical protein